MAGKVVNSRFMLLSKLGANRQESALKTATSHIRKPLAAINQTRQPRIIWHYQTLEHLHLKHLYMKCFHYKN